MADAEMTTIDRIRQLNAIDKVRPLSIILPFKDHLSALPAILPTDSTLLTPVQQDVTSLLSAAGNAIRALTLLGQAPSSQALSSDTPPQGPSIEECKATFTEQSARYFSLVSSIDVNIRRNIYGLEEAGIVSAEASAAAAGGLGELDIGWLNSRNDKVGKEMEAELWGKAADLLKRAAEREGEETAKTGENKV